MSNPLDLSGETFGDWVVTSFRGKGKGRGSYEWNLVCVCGQVGKATTGKLRSGRTLGCGCRSANDLSKRKTTHGHSSRKSGITSTYRAWCSAKRRCFDPKCERYPRYGGRGITMCDRWKHSFEAFLDDMGEKPHPSLQLDRMNNNGNYEPGNCKWSTRSQQMKNRDNWWQKLPRKIHGTDKS